MFAASPTRHPWGSGFRALEVDFGGAALRAAQVAEREVRWEDLGSDVESHCDSCGCDSQSYLVKYTIRKLEDFRAAAISKTIIHS